VKVFSHTTSASSNGSRDKCGTDAGWLQWFSRARTIPDLVKWDGLQSGNPMRKSFRGRRYAFIMLNVLIDMLAIGLIIPRVARCASGQFS
jgi:hypothetical protein